MNRHVADIAAKIHQGIQASALYDDSCRDCQQCQIFPFQVVCFQVCCQVCCQAYCWACYQDPAPVLWEDPSEGSRRYSESCSFVWDTEVSLWEVLSFRWRALRWRTGDVLEVLMSLGLRCGGGLRSSD